MDDFWRRIEEDFSGYRGQHHPKCSCERPWTRPCNGERLWPLLMGCWDEDWNLELPKPQDTVLWYGKKSSSNLRAMFSALFASPWHLSKSSIRWMLVEYDGLLSQTVQDVAMFSPRKWKHLEGLQMRLPFAQFFQPLSRNYSRQLRQKIHLSMMSCCWRLVSFVQNQLPTK